jgi:hypothetical protein
MPDPNDPMPNAQPEGADCGPESESGGSIPGTGTTYGRDAAAIAHEAALATQFPDGDPLGKPIVDLPIEYLTPEGYVVCRNLMEVYERTRNGAPRGTIESLYRRMKQGMEAFENQPLAENPLGDAPVE